MISDLMSDLIGDACRVIDRLAHVGDLLLNIVVSKRLALAYLMDRKECD